MALFTLKVQFTGLCSFVPNDELPKATKLMVVLPNADFPQIIGTPPPHALDGKSLRRHRGLVRVPLENLGVLTAPTPGQAIWYIMPGTGIEFMTDPPEKAASGLAITLGSKADSFTWVAPMAELMPRPYDIDPRAVGLTPPPDIVLGQVLIQGGTVTTSSVNKEVWCFKPPPASENIKPMAHEVTVTYGSLRKASIVTKVGGKTQTTDLLPNANSIVTVRILNACDDNPLEWSSVANPVVDEDFRWYYQLLPKSSQTTLVGKLTDGLGLPHPVGAGGGVNCSPLLWGKSPF